VLAAEPIRHEVAGPPEICAACHLVLDHHELVHQAGLGEPFNVLDDDPPGEPEYGVSDNRTRRDVDVALGRRSYMAALGTWGWSR
jgi:hypothetical protein